MSRWARDYNKCMVVAAVGGRNLLAPGSSHIPPMTRQKPVAASASRGRLKKPRVCGTCDYKCGYGCVVWHTGFKHPLSKHVR
eukprot:363073-Chlamydomonas_euryale.AAC.13